MGKHKDKIPGGLADKKKPEDFDRKKLDAGIKVELEHTSDRAIAQEIAMDHLMEDENYYSKLKEIEKYDRVDREVDGKQELDYGKEELDKDKKKKSLKDRWGSLKKALDNKDAFYNLDDAIEEDEDEQEDVDVAQAAPEETQDAEEGDSKIPEWLPEGVAIEGQDASPSDDTSEQQDEEEEQQPEGSEEDDEDIEEMLRQAGHSDAEIAHILHGHMVPQVDEAKRAKAEAEYAGIDRDQQGHEKEMQLRDQEAQIENEHAKRMKDVEYDRAQKEAGLSDVEVEHAKRMKDLEYQRAQAEAQVNEAQLKAEHAKRMLDLEYETAKQQKQLELDYKKKEMEMKLKHSDELAQQKHKDKLAQAKDDAKMKAQEKKKASKMKKSEDGSDDLQKAYGWSFNPKTQQFNHSKHGSIAVRPTNTRGFEIIHNGKIISSHDSHEGVKSGLSEYMSGLKSKPTSIRVSGAVPKQTAVTLNDPLYTKNKVKS